MIKTVEELSKLKIVSIKNNPFEIEATLINSEKILISNSLRASISLVKPQETKFSPEVQDLIYGKNELKNVVSVATKDDKIHIYTEANGKIGLTIEPMTYYILASKEPSIPHTKLSGTQPYKYLLKFRTKQELAVVRKIGFNKRIGMFNITSPEDSYLVRKGVSYFKGMKVSDVSVLSFDIETTGLNSETSQVLMISNTLRRNGELVRELFSLDDYDSEADMISSWCEWVRKVNPSVILGHNIYSFDLPFLASRAGEQGLRLGRDGSPLEFSEKISKFRKDGSQSYDYKRIQIFGREIVDTFFLSIRYDIGRLFPSYGLKPIVEFLGLETKDRIKWDFTKHKPIDTYNNRKENPELYTSFKQYCSMDSDDALKLYDLMIPAYFYMNTNIPMTFTNLNLSATGKQIDLIMIRSYLQKGASVAKMTATESIGGGISLAVPGLHKNCLALDLVSLYPSIILEYRLYDNKKDPDKNFLTMIEYFFNMRKEYKEKLKATGDKYYDDLQLAAKLIANSGYGALNAGLNYNSPDIADQITRLGRNIMKKTILWATGKDISFWDSEYNSDRD